MRVSRSAWKRLELRNWRHSSGALVHLDCDGLWSTFGNGLALSGFTSRFRAMVFVEALHQ